MVRLPKIGEVPAAHAGTHKNSKYKNCYLNINVSTCFTYLACDLLRKCTNSFFSYVKCSDIMSFWKTSECSDNRRQRKYLYQVLKLVPITPKNRKFLNIRMPRHQFWDDFFSSDRKPSYPTNEGFCDQIRSYKKFKVSTHLSVPTCTTIWW
jgi:hypothetical protein